MKRYPLLIGILGVLCAMSFAKEAPDYYALGMTAYDEGNFTEAANLLDIAFEADEGNSVVAYNCACSYSLAGEEELALQWLEIAVDLGICLFEGDPDFDNIRDGDGFKALVERADEEIEAARAIDWQPNIFLPDSYDETESYPLLIMLHGYGSNPNAFCREEFVETFTGRGLIYVVPYGPEIFGMSSFSWGEAPVGELYLLELLADLLDDYPVDTERLYLGGFSQGGSYSFYMGIRHADLLAGIIPMAGRFDAEELAADLERLKKDDLRCYITVGGLEPIWRMESNAVALERLTELGVATELRVFPGAGHNLPHNATEEFNRALDFVLGD